MAALRSGRLFLARFLKNSVNQRTTIHNVTLEKLNLKMRIFSLGENMNCAYGAGMSTAHPRVQSKDDSLSQFTSQVSRGGPTSKTVDEKLHGLHLYYNRRGLLLEEDVAELINTLALVEEPPSSNQILYTLRCCSDFLPDVPSKVRHEKFVEPLMQIAKSRNIEMDISHYNALLKCYIDNDHTFTPLDFLETLAENNLEANRVTYQYLISKYCKDGDLNGTTTILEHMKEEGAPVNEPIFESLVYGHAKIGNFEEANNLTQIMKDLGLEPDHLTHISKMKGMIANGQDISAIIQELDQSIENGILFDDTDHFTLMVDFCENGNPEAAKILLERTPSRAGHYKVFRSHAPRIIASGHPELALEILDRLLERDTRISSELQRDHRDRNGVFMFRSMIQANMAPDKIIELFDQYHHQHYPERRKLENDNILLNCCADLINVYIRDGKFEEGAKFVELASQKYGKEVLKSRDFPFNWSKLVQKNFLSPKETADLMINIASMGFPMTSKLVNEVFFSNIIKTSQESSLFDTVSLVMNQLQQSGQKNIRQALPKWKLYGSAIHETLSQNNPQKFKDVASFLALHPGNWGCGTWSGALARNYYMTNDIDSLITIIFNASLRLYLNRMDGEYFGERENQVFEVLPSLHQIVASQDGGGSQTTPDSALDKVLQKLEELKLGIPQSCTDSLNTIVKDQLVLDRIKVLRNNYDLMLNWTGTEKKAFEDNMRKKALENSGYKPSASSTSLKKNNTLDLTSEDGLTKIVDIMIRNVQNGVPKSFINRKLVSDLLSLYAKRGQKDKIINVVEKLRKIPGNENFEVAPVDICNLLANHSEKSLENFKEFPFEKLRTELPYLYWNNFLQILNSACEKGQYDDAVQALKFIEEQKENFFFVDTATNDINFGREMKNLAHNVADSEKFDLIYASIKKILPNFMNKDDKKVLRMDGLDVLNRVANNKLEEAVDIYEKYATEKDKLHFLPQLMKELVLSNSQALMQRVIDINLDAKSEERVLYEMSSIFIDMGRSGPAKKMMQTSGLRYIKNEIDYRCGKLMHKPSALKEFVKLCKPLFGSDMIHLYDILLDGMANDPDEVADLWIQMQEDNYLPLDRQMIKMADILKKHNRNVPFNVPKPKSDKKPASKSNKEKEKEKGAGEKITSSKSNSKPSKEKQMVNILELQDVDKLDIPQSLERLKTDKKLGVPLIKHAIKLMKKDEDFSELGNLIKSSQFRGGINAVTSELLEQNVNSEILKNVNLIEFYEKSTQWSGLLAATFLRENNSSVEDAISHMENANVITKVGSYVWSKLIIDKPESAKFLKEKCETLNDPIFSSRMVIALTHANHLELANQVVESNQLENDELKKLISKENSLERCDKMLQFARANPRLNLVDVIEVRQKFLSSRNLIESDNKN